MKRFHPKLFVHRFILIIVSVVLSFCVLEGVTRIFKPQITVDSITLPYDFNCFIHTPEYPVLMKPNSTCPLRSTDNQFPDTIIRTNSLGIRNPEITIPKPADTFRILVLGDSYVTGWGVDEAQTFVRLTESELRKRHPTKKIELINAGSPSAGVGYYYLFIKNYLADIDPDAVVIATYLFNDVVANSYFSTWEKVDEAGLPTTITSGNQVVVSGQTFPADFPWWIKVPILNKSHTFALVASTFSPHASKLTPQSGISPQACYYKPFCKDLDEAKEKVKKLFTAIKSLTDTRDTHLMLAVIPSEIQFDRKARLKYGITIPILPSQRDYPYVYFGQFFNELGTPWLELRKHLSQDEGRLYFEADDHWTPLGHKKAAEALSDFLNPLIESR